MGKTSRFSGSVMGLFFPNGFAASACHPMLMSGQSVDTEPGGGKWVRSPGFQGP